MGHLFAAGLLLCAASASQAVQATAEPPPLTPSTEGEWEGESVDAGRFPVFLTVRVAAEPAGAILFVLGQTIPMTWTSYDIGFIARAGADATLRVEGVLHRDRLFGRLVDGDRVLPFTLVRVPTASPSTSPLQSWTEDLDHLESRLPRWERSLTPATRAAFLAATARLRRDLPRLDEAQVMARMAAAMAVIGNAHTRLYLVRVRTRVRFLPIRLWWFDDGLRVIAARPTHRELLGCRVARIDGHSAAQARRAMAPAYAGNAGWRDYMSTYTLASPDLLHGFGVTKEADSATFEFADCAAAGAPVRLNALPLQRSNSTVENWWDLTPARTPDGWLNVLAERGVPPPLHLQGGVRHYWHTFLPNQQALYVQYNRAAEMADESIASYTERLLAELALRPVKALIIDLRLNTGGNSLLAKELWQRLAAASTGLRRFVITGNTTFSAGISDAVFWHQPGVTFVGEPVGDTLDFWSEGGNVVLPHSGLAAHFANGPHRYSPAPCPPGLYCIDANVSDLGPNVRTATRWSDYVGGRDPALDAVLTRLDRPLAVRRVSADIFVGRHRRASP